MVTLEISADISQSKMLEFNQSKLLFIDKLQSMDGYSGFKEKTGNTFMMKINWTNRKSLNNFMKSENYRIFRGAIITLSKTESTKILAD